MSMFTDKQRGDLAKKGQAMPDGGYPIRNRSDLLNAIQSYGRGKNKPEIKRWIKKRAKELNAEKYLPENWDTDDEEDSLAHYGVKGMKWGVRKRSVENTGSGGSRRSQYRALKKQAKADRKASMQKAYNSYMSDLNLINRTSKDTIENVIRRSRLYDKQVSAIKSDYKTQIKTGRDIIYKKRK